MPDTAKLQTEARKKAEDRLKDNPSTAPDRDSADIGWTSQQGPKPVTEADEQARYAKWQLPDPDVARAAGFPPLDVPERLIRDDAEEGFYGQHPRERVTREGEALKEQHPSDVPTEEKLKAGAATSGADADAGLEDKNKDELLALAKDRGVEGYSKMTKDQLVAALQ